MKKTKLRCWLRQINPLAAFRRVANRFQHTLQVEALLQRRLRRLLARDGLQKTVKRVYVAANPTQAEFWAGKLIARTRVPLHGGELLPTAPAAQFTVRRPAIVNFQIVWDSSGQTAWRHNGHESQNKAGLRRPWRSCSLPRCQWRRPLRAAT